MVQWVKDYFREHKRTLKNILITASTTIIVLATLIPVTIQAGIQIEARYYPVISDFTIETVEKTTEGNSVISGTFIRNRRCPLEYVEWTLENPTNEVDVPIPRYNSKTPDTKPGLNKFQGVTLYITPNNLLRNVTGTAYYRCHNYWLTRVKFYDARRNA